MLLYIIFIQALIITIIFFPYFSHIIIIIFYNKYNYLL